MLQVKKYEIISLAVSAFFLCAGIAMWALFWPIFTSELQANYKLGANRDGSMKYATFLYSNPPMKNVMKFHFFNVTNPDEVVYLGAKPELIETGGYGILESEQKKYTDFTEDKTKMFYQNYKKYLYSPENNDEGISYDDQITFPNPISTGATSVLFGPTSTLTKNAQLIASVGMMLLGEYPMISKSVKDSLFDGFDDPLLDIAHSPIFTVLTNLLGLQEVIANQRIPEMRKFAYMSGYNNTFDENYWVNTGHDDFNRLGYVEQWAGLTELPESFWPTKDARKILGPDSGSLSKIYLTEDDELPFFMSFMCRSFKKTFWKKETVNGIHTLAFSVPKEDFDTTLEKNIGFRYQNLENINYYPSWPPCDKKNCSVEDCKLCNGGNIVNGTYLLPPGMFPVVCYPGHTNQPPFTVLVSPPHFLYSPVEVQNQLSGISPDPEKHKPMVFNQEKLSGTALQVRVRFQINMPINNNKGYILTSQLPNVIVPLFYEDAHAVVDNFVFNTVWVGVVLAPRIVDYFKFALIFISLCILTVLIVLRTRVKSSSVIPM